MKKRLVLIVLLCCVLALGGCFKVEVQPTGVETAKEYAERGDASLEEGHYTEAISLPPFKIKFHSPDPSSFSGGGNLPATFRYDKMGILCIFGSKDS